MVQLVVVFSLDLSGIQCWYYMQPFAGAVYSLAPKTDLLATRLIVWYLYDKKREKKAMQHKTYL